MAKQEITAEDYKRQALETVRGTISQLNTLAEAIEEDLSEDGDASTPFDHLDKTLVNVSDGSYNAQP